MTKDEQAAARRAVDSAFEMKRVTGEPLSSVYYDLRLALDALERVSALADSYENDPMKRPLYDRLITVQMIRTAIAGSGADGEATT